MSTPEERQWDMLFRRLDRIENKQDKMLTREEFKEFAKETEGQIENLEEDVQEIRAAAITPDQISNMVGTTLQKSEARGWTQRDRFVRYGLAILSLLTFLILAVQTWLQHS